MITAEILMHNHILYEQNYVNAELIKHGAISGDFFGENKS